MSFSEKWGDFHCDGQPKCFKVVPDHRFSEKGWTELHGKHFCSSCIKIYKMVEYRVPDIMNKLYDGYLGYFTPNNVDCHDPGDC